MNMNACVHFIGAGPGAVDLITVRGMRLLQRCDWCLYAGSTVNEELLNYCGQGVRLINTAPLDLPSLAALYKQAADEGHQIARLHSGDLSFFSALAEQLRILEQLSIPYTLTPGVPAFAAASALLQRELTVPAVTQSVVLTRIAGRASAMPPNETLESFAATGATLAVHLAVQQIENVVERVRPFYGNNCPAAVVYRASWPDERIIKAPLNQLAKQVRAAAITRSALILIGPALEASSFEGSALYTKNYARQFRVSK